MCQIILEMEVHECCDCGITFAMSKELDAQYQKNKKSFYCPKGHRQHYLGETCDQKLRKKLKQHRNDVRFYQGVIQDKNEQINEHRGRANAYKGLYKKAKGNGTKGEVDIIE